MLEKSQAGKVCLKGDNLFLDNSAYLIKDHTNSNRSVSFYWSV